MGEERLIPLARRYRLLSVGGMGGMGTVWRARDEMLDRDVAVKEVRLPERLTGGERRVLCRRLIGEARATAALRHPGVVELYDVVIEDGRPWIVMEFVRGRSLHEAVAEDGPFGVARAAEVGAAVLSVLRAAHRAGILHRDVKPSNILLCDDGRVLLSDFGLAVHMDRGGQEIAETLVAGIEGSPAYLPPERVRGEPSLEASDLWSFGATLYAAVEGTPPFLRRHALASMVAVLLGEYPPPERAGALAPVITGLLREDPRERLTAEATAALLDGAARPVPEPRGENAADDAAPDAAAGARAARLVPWRRRTATLVTGRRPRLGAVASVAALALLSVGLGTWASPWTSVGKSEAVALLPAPGAELSTITYHEPDGYSVDVPVGWAQERDGSSVRWRSPDGDQTLRVAPVGGDPLAGLRAAERAAAEGGLYPGYRRLRLEATPEVSNGAAEWEFTWNGRATGPTATSPNGTPDGTPGRASEGAPGEAPDGAADGTPGDAPDDTSGGVSGPSYGTSRMPRVFGLGGMSSIGPPDGLPDGSGGGLAGGARADGPGGGAAGGASRGHGLRSRAAGYEFSFFAPEAEWTPGQRLYDKILKSFRPDRP
ncbi:serine/threonine-protein kinase [Actinomadura yumaensis]|uniref:non-specific serine/threonine protein kinase n=1 Tax=Actinomadura yumaensis TaxID=111807 RepID=A0ABW2CR28_9ACTN